MLMIYHYYYNNNNKTPAQAFTLASEWGDTCYGVIDMGVGELFLANYIQPH